jgi:integrative and conjugative element protein (TIGR02256 family)
LDDLEIQLAMAAHQRKEIETLFLRSDGRAIQYAAACRDLTAVLPQDTMAIAAGVASRFVKKYISSARASITVWHLGAEELGFVPISIQPTQVLVRTVADWEIRTSVHALRKMCALRHRQLPNETGGVLLGSIDAKSRTIYIASVLGATPDSTQWPMEYRKGIRGLSRVLSTIRRLTGGNIGYVGEWHTHPAGCAATPSGADLKALDWITSHMSEEGWPGLMAIVGDAKEPNFVLGRSTFETKGPAGAPL